MLLLLVFFFHSSLSLFSPRDVVEAGSHWQLELSSWASPLPQCWACRCTPPQADTARFPLLPAPGRIFCSPTVEFGNWLSLLEPTPFPPVHRLSYLSNTVNSNSLCLKCYLRQMLWGTSHFSTLRFSFWSNACKGFLLFFYVHMIDLSGRQALAVF